MKHGPPVFFGIVGSSVVLSYVALPVFMVVLKVAMAALMAVVLWFLLFEWWLVPSSKTSWTPNLRAEDVTVQPPPEHSAMACAKVLARRQADRLRDSEVLLEIQASLRVKR